MEIEVEIFLSWILLEISIIANTWFISKVFVHNLGQLSMLAITEFY